MAGGKGGPCTARALQRLCGGVAARLHGLCQVIPLLARGGLDGRAPACHSDRVRTAHTDSVTLVTLSSSAKWASCSTCYRTTAFLASVCDG